jgi:hypothetical protein
MSPELDPALILASCPLQPEFERILALTGDLTAAFSLLRQKRVACRSCPHMDGCPFWTQFDAQVQAAIRSVLHELGRL